MENPSRHARIEPLFAALEEEVEPLDPGTGPTPRPGGLAAKLVWAALVLVGLIVLVVQQSF